MRRVRKKSGRSMRRMPTRARPGRCRAAIRLVASWAPSTGRRACRSSRGRCATTAQASATATIIATASVFQKAASAPKLEGSPEAARMSEAVVDGEPISETDVVAALRARVEIERHLQRIAVLLREHVQVHRPPFLADQHRAGEKVS